MFCQHCNAYMIEDNNGFFGLEENFYCTNPDCEKYLIFFTIKNLVLVEKNLYIQDQDQEDYNEEYAYV